MVEDHIVDSILHIVDSILQQRNFCKLSEISIALSSGSTIWNPEATCSWCYILSKYPHKYCIHPGNKSVSRANWKCKDASMWRVLRESFTKL